MMNARDKSRLIKCGFNEHKWIWAKQIKWRTLLFKLLYRILYNAKEESRRWKSL